MTRRLHRSVSRRNSKIIISALLLLIGVFILVQGIKYFPVWYGLLFKKDIVLNRTDQRINILLLGIGGGRHDGPNLTDTIILASIDPEKKKATLISIPRDLWIPDLKAKINYAYAYGESREKGGGLLLSKAVVSKVLGQEIDYALRVDFDGFIKAVDMVGGLDVNVERKLDDPEYPISGKEDDPCDHKEEELQALATASSQLDAFPCRYEHLVINPGLQHMDGETALKFVRSRHAKGSEGSDFARSKRQEKIISAFQDKVFSAGTFLNPVKIVSLLDVFKASIDTDITQEEYDDFVRLAQKMKGAKMQSIVLDVGDEEEGQPGLLDNPAPTEAYRYQWVLAPRRGDGNFSQIHKYVACQIVYDECDILSGVPIPTPTAIPSE